MIDGDLPLWANKFSPCDKCNHGFIIEEETSKKCDCRKEYETYLKTGFCLMTANILTANSTKSSYDFFTSYSLDSYKGNDSPGNLYKLKIYKKPLSGAFLFPGGADGS